MFLRSVLFVEETGVPPKKPLSYKLMTNFVLSTPHYSDGNHIHNFNHILFCYMKQTMFVM